MCVYLCIRDFFFGSKATTFDALLFGHLADAMADLNFVVLLSQFENLTRFFNFVCGRVFSDKAELGVQYIVPGEINADSPRDAGLKMIKRADYVNRMNNYNQLRNSLICSQAPFVPVCI